MSATRAVLLGGAFGGVSGGIVGGGVAQFFSGPENKSLLWLAAFIGAIVGSICSALVTRSGVCNENRR
jgi:hypothetical protein